jgi:hypothetical protein
MGNTFEDRQRLGQTGWLNSRDVGGFFNKIWSVHPIADVGGSTSRKLETHNFSLDHTILEGVSRSHPRWPNFLAPLDFLLSQLNLVRLLRRIVRQEKVSLIITTDPLYGGLLGLLLKSLCGVALVVGVVGNFELAYRDSGALMMPRLFPFYWLQRYALHLEASGCRPNL